MKYSLEAEEKPKMWGRSEVDCDLWLDFFDTLEEAEAFARKCYKA